jgi:hypothetical protein
VRVSVPILLVFVALLCGNPVSGQSPNASISGIVLDPDKRLIAGADILVMNDYTRVQYEAKTNAEGFFAVTELPPGQYRLQVSKVGFKAIIKPDIILNVQDALALTFTLPIGASSVVVTVEGGAPQINTTDASVSTVVDRQFAENLPMNGRTFQSLIYLTPGVVATTSNAGDGGQFSVNGQRTASNYWMVDGVSANIGIGFGGLSGGNGLGGTLGSFSALGGTNSLVSIDAMQEFRIQTSTFAPEFGRTPGAQISIATRSGTNEFHGAAFDYFRNDALDANNWFADASSLPKPRERQNDFGVTLGGPIVKDRAFFFFSYEGLRLELPQTTLTSVPDLAARESAAPAMQPYLKAFPLDPRQQDLGNGAAEFNASYANPATLDAYSLRIDDNLNHAITVWGRYNYSPSQEAVRGGGGSALSMVDFDRITTQSITAGMTWAASPFLANDLRFNYSHVAAQTNNTLDSFGGALPLTSIPFPSSYDTQNSNFGLGIFSLTDGFIYQGFGARNVQRQINLVDRVSLQKGRHSFRFGVDFRRLTPIQSPFLYGQSSYFGGVPQAETGSLEIAVLQSTQPSSLLFRNLGLYAQDTWRVTPRLAVTYGLRWDIDFTPSSISGPVLVGVTGYSLEDPSKLALASAGTPPFHTYYTGFAPRIGVAYQVSPDGNWQTVARGGFGVFYDLVDSEVGNITNHTYYPFGASRLVFGPSFGGTAMFPLDASDAAPPPITTTQGIQAFDPNLKVPYTLQWNVALEQSLGGDQTVTVSYVGAAGKRLLQTAYLESPNPNFATALLVGDAAESEYNALQLQFQRRLSRGLQALASYTLSHSMDDASAGSIGNFANGAPQGLDPRVNFGPSDFDIRHVFSAAIIYEIPSPHGNPFVNAIARGWSFENIVEGRSALPVNVSVGASTVLNGNRVQIRPNVVPGIPLYLYGPQYPGGKALNNTPAQGGPGCSGPFCAPPAGQQGDLGRNSLRGFGMTEWDLAIHRDFPILESRKLQFRAEIFNVLNHPNFGPPLSDITMPSFGVATETFGQYLAGTNGAGGGLNPLYQPGGPRSIQLALKLVF